MKPKVCWTLHAMLRNRHRPAEPLESCQCFSLKQMVNVLTRWVLDVKPFSWRVPASTHDPEGGHPYMFPSFPQFLEAYYRGEKKTQN